VGVSISRHYSGGELYSIALYGEATSCCEVPGDCCDDETDVIQFTADYVFSLSTTLDHSETVIDLFTDYTFFLLPQFDNVDDIARIYYPVDSHPPRETGTYLSEIQAYLL